MTPKPRTDALAKEYAGVTSCNPNALLTEVQNMELKVAQLERELAEANRSHGKTLLQCETAINQLQQRVKELEEVMMTTEAVRLKETQRANLAEAKCAEMRKLLFEALTDDLTVIGVPGWEHRAQQALNPQA